MSDAFVMARRLLDHGKMIIEQCSKLQISWFCMDSFTKLTIRELSDDCVDRGMTIACLYVRDGILFCESFDKGSRYKIGVEYSGGEWSECVCERKQLPTMLF